LFVYFELTNQLHQNWKLSKKVLGSSLRERNELQMPEDKRFLFSCPKTRTFVSHEGSVFALVSTAHIPTSSSRIT